MTMLEQMARFLASRLGYAFEGDSDGSVFFGYLPEKPVKAICVYANELRASGDRDGTRIQVGIRSDMDGAWPLETAVRIMALLDDAHDLLFTEDGKYINRIETQSGFEYAGLDSNNTQFYTANFRVYCCG